MKRSVLDDRSARRPRPANSVGRLGMASGVAALIADVEFGLHRASGLNVVVQDVAIIATIVLGLLAVIVAGQQIYRRQKTWEPMLNLMIFLFTIEGLIFFALRQPGK